MTLVLTLDIAPDDSLARVLSRLVGRAVTGPFATIELNAPGGIADYCARYTGFYKRLQAKPAGVEVFEDDNIASILREWGKQATPEQLDAMKKVHPHGH